MQRVLVIGGSGMLGHKLLEALQTDFEVFSTVRQPFERYTSFRGFRRERIFDQVELKDWARVSSVVREVAPDVVINAAGIVKQNSATQDVVKTLTINSVLPRKLADLSADLDFRLISISTDCVFRGLKGNYSESDVSDVNDLYGLSKYLGEVTKGNCLTLRTSIIGRELLGNHGLLEWFLANRNGRVKGFSKAVFSGFPTIIFSRIINDILLERPDLSGLYHVSSEPINKFELLSLINSRFETAIEIEDDPSYKIDRSLNSEKFRAETGFKPLPWKEMVDILADDSANYDQN